LRLFRNFKAPIQVSACPPILLPSKDILKKDDLIDINRVEGERDVDFRVSARARSSISRSR
jgi:hypothetical protein